MGQLGFALRLATESEHDVIVGLIDEAADWLRTKNTDQWAQPWPSEEDRANRIRRDLVAGRTWIAWEDGTPVATITAARWQNQIWPPGTRSDPAVYVCRLVVSRAYAGRGIGAALLDWAGVRARGRYRARWVRVDVWTTNKALHEYYRRQGFVFWGFCEAVGDYPSAALFQKPTAPIRLIHPPLLHELPFTAYPCPGS